MKLNHKKTFSNRVCDKDVLRHYKSFSKVPHKFKELYDDSDNSGYSSSSSDDDSSSSEDFPSPSTIKKYKKSSDYGELFGKINNLQKRLYQMEIKQQKKSINNRH